MARNKLTSGRSASAAAAYTTAPAAPGANNLVLVFALNAAPGCTIPALPTIAGNGLTWDQVATVIGGTNGNQRLTCFRAMSAAPAVGAVTLSFGAQTQDLCAWSIFEYDSVDQTGVNGAGAIVQSVTRTGNGPKFSVPLSPFADPINDTAIGAVIVELFVADTRQVSPDPGVAEIDKVAAVDASSPGVILETLDKIGGVTNVTWHLSGFEATAAIALELRAAASASSSLEDLARRFEPILFLHRQEKFLPSDAKRYVEHCALWKSQAAFDSKDDWGGQGQPFDRKPMIPTGKIAALMGEPGMYLGDPANLIDNKAEERFLEIGGWRDKSGNAQPGVTATSNNTYSNRNAITDLYLNQKALTDSQFWYHAEMFDEARLQRLLQNTDAPQLVGLIPHLKNRLLLCYYMLFPGHDQPLEPLCTNVEAIEMGSFAGDWACMAVLLLRNPGAASFQPTHIGLTGLHPAPFQGAAGISMYPPSAYDDERRSCITVAPWPSGTSLPQLVDEHPRLYVALGTHSLYLTSGTHDVEPYPADIQPQLCVFDTPALAPPPGGDPGLNSLEVWLAKVFGSVPFLGPLGIVAGLTAAALEGMPPAPQGLSDIGTDPANSGAPDETTAAGHGKTIRPAGLSISDAGNDVSDWRSAQGLILDGRRYDFLVDRTTQVWWPGDGGETGFRGRWGQRVETDPVPRRCGIRFPAFHKMFFLAFAQGLGTGQLTI